MLDVTGHVPLCLVQHDDRTDRELTHLRPLLDLNRAACEVEPDQDENDLGELADGVQLADGEAVSMVAVVGMPKPLKKRTGG